VSGMGLSLLALQRQGSLSAAVHTTPMSCCRECLQASAVARHTPCLTRSCWLGPCRIRRLAPCAQSADYSRITQLRSSIAEHKAIQTQYTDISRDRAARFKEIARLVDEAKSIKLPENLPLSHFEEDAPEAMDVDPIEPETLVEEKPAPRTASRTDTAPSAPGSSSSGGNNTGGSSRLNVIALPFQPSGPSGSSQSTSGRHHGSSSNPTSRSSTPAPSAPGKNDRNSSRSGLPQRPGGGQSNNQNSRGASSNMRGGSSLPSRPSALRSVTTPGPAGGGSLEEGEVGDAGEEGEVKDRGGQFKGTKRPSPAGERGGRSTRSRK